MSKVVTVEKVAKLFKDRMTIMIGGFLGIGEPLVVIDELVSSGVKELTLISVVGAYPGGGFGIGKLTANKMVKKFIGSHIGTDPELVKQFNTGEIEVEFNPMGTWVERIRAGGGGLGGVLTPTGLGTEVEEGRDKIKVEGKEFLLFPPLRADIAIIKAHKADKHGNLEYRGISINSNPIMATAADIVIAEVDEIVEEGEIPYNQVGTQGLFVDMIVQGQSLDERKTLFQSLWLNTKRLVPKGA
jgi:acetate CoA/acetoacetate CoA-transferase alpha subunit